MIKGWKYSLIELLKVTFICHQQTTKKQQSSAWKFFQTLIQVRTGASIIYFKFDAPLFCCPLFSKNISTQGQDQQNGKMNSVD